MVLVLVLALVLVPVLELVLELELKLTLELSFEIVLAAVSFDIVNVFGVRTSSESPSVAVVVE